MKRPGDDNKENASEHKRSKFVLPARPEPKERVIPKAYALRDAQKRKFTPQPPPSDIASKLAGVDLIIGMDCETHVWEKRQNTPGDIGQFGFYTIRHPDDYLVRIVQIGWAICAAPDQLTVKERIIKPCDFRVSAKAALYRRVSHDRAVGMAPRCDPCSESLCRTC